MKELKTNLLIVGGGLTGLMTAFALSSLDKNIILLDRSHFLSNKKWGFRDLDYEYCSVGVHIRSE